MIDYVATPASDGGTRRFTHTETRSSSLTHNQLQHLVQHPTRREMIATPILFVSDDYVTLICDAKCDKAWGINSRPRIDFDSDDPDDYAFKADGELGEAPECTGIWEGGDGKPRHDKDRHNKWCARECERSCIVDPNNDFQLPDFSERRYNMPSLHDERGEDE